MPFTTYRMGSQCLTCTFRASCCSARLSRAQDGGGGGGDKGGDHLYKGVQAVRLRSVAGGGTPHIIGTPLNRFSGPATERSFSLGEGNTQFSLRLVTCEMYASYAFDSLRLTPL